MLQQNFSTPHFTNIMENVADFLQFCLLWALIGDDYLCRKEDFFYYIHDLTQGQKFPASSERDHT